jgi:hypothetical protein
MGCWSEITEKITGGASTCSIVKPACWPIEHVFIESHQHSVPRLRFQECIDQCQGYLFVPIDMSCDNCS